MSLAKDLDITPDSFPENAILPPDDLYSNEPPLETELHLRQIILLINSLEWLWRDRNDFYAMGNLTIYYSPRQRKSEDFRGPDFFVVLNTERRPRNSWIVWHEDGKYPNIIIEIMSESTANTDRVEKKQIYQDVFRTPDYFWFDPKTLELAGFNLIAGNYQPVSPNDSGYLWSQQLGLYLGVYENKLRFFTPEGTLVATSEEVAEQATQRAEKLAAKLRELNINPDTI